MVVPGGRPNRPKVSVVGAGSVGATLAYAALVRGLGGSIALYDLDAAKVEAEVLDLNHGVQFVPAAHVEGSDDPAVCDGSDVIVVTAGAKQKPGQTRLDLAAANVAMCRDLVPRLVAGSPDTMLLLVTNPVDVVTYACLRYSGLPAGRVFGSGTVLDSSRLRYLVAEATGVAVANVHAYVVGEHGDSELPLWSTAAIGGIPVLDWAGGALSAAERDRIAAEVTGAAYRIIAGKGATNYAIGLAATRVLEAVLRDERRVLPVSSLLRPAPDEPGRLTSPGPAALAGEGGDGEVCLSLPSIVDRSGVAAVLDVPLSAEERAGLAASAAAVRNTARSLGL